MKESLEPQEPKYLEVFHAAQAKLLEGDIETGQELLVQAAELTEDLGDEEDFLEYIRGTQAYLAGDQEGLRASIDSLKGSPNVPILERFLARLESGEDVDYSTDYQNQV